MMPIYIVTKDRDICGATYKESEAFAIFDKCVYAGDYREASVLVVPAVDGGRRVLRQAGHLR
jgi:hypothetical protein